MQEEARLNRRGSRNLKLVNNALENQWIELFAAGDHGDKGKYTAADLDHIVQKYQPAQHEAPVVIGHPATNLPAFGWVSALKREGQSLFGKFKQVQPAFAEMVKNGAFKKRSVALYRKPDGLELRHVGFLGAQPPEIKGLADVAFQDDNAEVVEITFQEETTVDEQKIADNLWERFKAKFSPATETTTVKEFSEAEHKAAVDAAVAEAMKPIREAEAARATEFAEAQRKVAAAGTTAKAAEAIAKVKAAGRWVPAFDAMNLPVIFNELAKSTEVVEFSEGEGDKKVTVKKLPLELLVTFMEGLKKIVPADPIYTGKTATGAASDVQFSENETKADPNSVQLTALAQQRAKDKSITFGEALDQIVAEQPQLLKPGSSTAGEV